MRSLHKLLLVLGVVFGSVLLSGAAPAAEDPGYALSASPEAVLQDHLVTVNWSKPAGSPAGFIGIYDTGGELVDFVYPEASATSGALTRQVPFEPGGYFLRWISLADGKSKAEAFFQTMVYVAPVVVPGYTLTLEESLVEPGGALILHWTKPAGTSYGFFGLYNSDENRPGDGAENYLALAFPDPVGNSGVTGLHVPEDLEPGGYFVAWHSDEYTVYGEYVNGTQYKVFVPFAIGEEGGPPQDPGEPDEPPTVSMTAPADGAHVSGTAVTVSADADHHGEAVSVQFQLDGVNLGAELAAAPFTINWNTALTPNGAHVLTAVARGTGHDAAPVISDPVAVTVENPVPGVFAKSSPANGASGQARVPTLSWGASSAAAHYEYCVDTINNNSCDTVWLETEETSAVAGGLSAGTTYYWQVKANNAAGEREANLGAWWSFATSPGGAVNVAAAINGATATASSFFNAQYAPSGAIDGDRRGQSWGNGGGWNDGTPDLYPDWLQVDFAGPQTIDEVDVFSVQDTYLNPVVHTLGLPFSLHGITAFQVQYWNGSAWVVVPGGDVSGNNQVWRQIAFSAITTSKIRIHVTGSLANWSRIVEVEAYADIHSAPGVFAKAAPANNAAGLAPIPTLSWSPSLGAASYEYCVDTINNNLCDTAWTSTLSTSTIVNGLNAGTTYFWQVRARNTNGTVEANSDTWWNFTTAVGGHVNVAAASNGATATASTFYSSAYAPAGAIDGNRKGQLWGNGGGWNDGTPDSYPDWLQVDFAGPQTIDEIDVFSVQDAYANPIEPFLGQQFTLHGVTAFQAQYWNGSSWVTVPNGSITGNNQVWRQITFSAITTSKIRINVTASLLTWSRIVEVEAYSDLQVLPGALAKSGPANGSTGLGLGVALSWGASSNAASYEVCVDTVDNNLCDTVWTSTPSTSGIAGGLNQNTTYFWQVRARNGTGATEANVGAWWSFTTGSFVNVAAAANGATATASSFFNAQYAPSGAIDGERKGQFWGNGGGWNDGTLDAYPDWLQVDFAGAKTISEVDVFTVQDAYQSPVTPTATQQFTLHGLTDFQVQYWNGSSWVDVPNGHITGNNLVWSKISFPALSTTRIRILVNASLASWSRITEVEAY